MITPNDIILDIVFFVKVTVLILLFLYVIFSLIIVRQVDLMAKTLVTPVSPIVVGISIINAGFAVGFLVIAFGIL